MKISLFLMTLKGYSVLDFLCSNNYFEQIDTVVIGVDNAVLNDYSKELVSLCKKNEINYFLSTESNYNISSSYCIAISWRWLLKSDKYKLIVLHDSLLPKYRGFAPLVNSLINGEEKLGVTALYASEEYDKGEIISQEEIKINYPIKIHEAILKISDLYIQIVHSLFESLKSNTILSSFPQNENDSSYSMWRNESDYFIDWNNSASYIKRFVDALGYPYKESKCYIGNQVVLIKNVSVEKDVKIENRDVGKVIFVKEGLPVVVCKEGLLKIEQAVYEVSNVNLLPLKKFRTRFT